MASVADFDASLSKETVEGLEWGEDDKQQVDTTTELTPEEVAAREAEAKATAAVNALTAQAAGVAVDPVATAAAAAAAEAAADAQQQVLASDALAAEIDPLLRGDDKDDLVVQQTNPDSPLYSLHSFEELGHLEGTVAIPPEIIKGIRENGFKTPSKIQEKALPILLRINKPSATNPTGKPENMVFQSQAGTGKTGAFGITMLTRVNPKVAVPQAVVVAPTFTLTVQIYEQLCAWSKYVEGLKVGLVYARTDKDDRDPRPVPPTVKARGVLTEQILVCTPGRLRNMISAKQRKQFDPAKLIMLVADEADDLIENHSENMAVIMGCITNPMAQKVMLSATFDESVMSVLLPKIEDPKTTITLPLQQCTMDSVRQLAYHLQEDKMEALKIIYRTVKVGQTIIFVNTRNTAEHVSKEMTANGYSVACLHGSLTKALQHETLSRFRSGEDKVLVSTNALARGVDVKAITMVVNYDIPEKRVYKEQGGVQFTVRADPETYLHRVGRTGRFGRKGAAINFVATKADEEMLHEISTHWQREIKTIDIRNEKQLKKNVSKK